MTLDVRLITVRGDFNDVRWVEGRHMGGSV